MTKVHDCDAKENGDVLVYETVSEILRNYASLH
jgi:hypothetical protein